MSPDREVHRMKKPVLQTHADAMAEAIGEVLRGSRTTIGECGLCGAEKGTQHSNVCALWPIIMARGKYRMAQELP